VTPGSSTARRRAAVFLDRDGTLIEDRGHLCDPSEVVFYPQAFGALRSLQERFLLFIVTNQRGVAEGLLTRQDVDRVNAHVLARFAQEGVTITDVYCCPHTREEGCQCIKPKPYFIQEAVRQYGVRPEESFAVGDHPHDADFAQNVGGTGIFVLTGHGEKHQHELSDDTIVAADIEEAATCILARCGDPGHAEPAARPG